MAAKELGNPRGLKPAARSWRGIVRGHLVEAGLSLALKLVAKRLHDPSEDDFVGEFAQDDRAQLGGDLMTMRVVGQEMLGQPGEAWGIVKDDAAQTGEGGVGVFEVDAAEAG